jgi:myo-inositol-1(or 4)-monophosphatase
METITLPTLAPLAQQVAQITREIGAWIVQERLSFSAQNIEFKGLNDLVSYVDRTAEKMLVERLGKLIAGSGFIGEEGTTAANDGRTTPAPGTYWIIDPLDGTTNFIHNLPLYTVSVGLLHNGELVLGCVEDPNRQHTYLAWQGGGAYLNDTRIQVSHAPDIESSLLATGFPYQLFDKQGQYLAIIDNLMRRSHGLRRCGSAALDLAWVASGRFDAFFEYNLKAWDCAGGIVLVREAGGTVTDFSGGNSCLFGGQILAGGPQLHSALQQVIAAHW